jgi:hypothetical protein
MRTLFTIAAVLLAAALPAVALGSRTPSHSEKVKLRNAVKSSKLIPKAIRTGAHFKLKKSRISTKGPWARATIIPTGVYSDPFDPDVGLFKRRHGKWKLVAAGSSRVGCSKPRAPRAVRKDLKLRCS